MNNFKKAGSVFCKKLPACIKAKVLKYIELIRREEVTCFSSKRNMKEEK